MVRHSLLFVLPLALSACGILGDKGSSSDDDDGGGGGWWDDTGGSGPGGGVGGDPGGTGDPTDEDGDGYGADEDCDDSNAGVYPGAAETCDGVDQDCDGVVDNDPSDVTTWYADVDGDGYGSDTSTQEACERPSGFVATDGDCDDGRFDVNPGREEVCNEIDDDCSGAIDDDPVDGGTYYTDADGDGFGKPGTEHVACEGTTNDLDCDDTDSSEPQVVSSSASGTETGTAANPWSSIQEGIDNSTDCVLVKSGTYYENIDFEGANITVVSERGSAYTTIDGYYTTSVPVVRFSTSETSKATLEGFTIRRGDGVLEETSEVVDCGSTATCTNYYNTWCGGGVYIDGADPTLIDVVVRDNLLALASSSSEGDDTTYTYSYGGGICLLDSNATLAGLRIYDNRADQGAGIYVDESSAVSLAQSIIYENDATDAGGIQVDSGSLTMTNVIITANTAVDEAGGVLVLSGQLTAENITMAGDDNGELYLTTGGSATLSNSIIYDAYDGYGVYSDGTGSFSGSYNNVYDNPDGNYQGVTDPTGSSGNLSSNPIFTTWSNNLDYADKLTLQASSPSVNAGNPAASDNDTDGSRNDQGAYGGPGGTF